MSEEEKIENLGLVLKDDFPPNTNIILPGTDKWEFVTRIAYQGKDLYVGALPAINYLAQPDEYFELPPKINLQLRKLKLFRLFLPHQDEIEKGYSNKSLEIESANLTTTLQILIKGEAKAWFGPEVGVIEYCRINRIEFSGGELLHFFWKAVEQNISATKLLTPIEGVIWDKNYTQMLSKLGYFPEPSNEGWWGKKLESPFAK